MGPGTPPTRSDSRASGHGHRPEITSSQTIQPSTPAKRKIEARLR